LDTSRRASAQADARHGVPRKADFQSAHSFGHFAPCVGAERPSVSAQ
jgi:hypothetical protein